MKPLVSVAKYAKVTLSFSSLRFVYHGVFFVGFCAVLQEYFGTGIRRFVRSFAFLLVQKTLYVGDIKRIMDSSEKEVTWVTQWNMLAGKVVRILRSISSIVCGWHSNNSKNKHISISWICSAAAWSNPMPGWQLLDICKCIRQW